jgi:site-specific recombinase XerD
VTAEVILKPKQLRIEELPFLRDLGHIENGILFLQRSPKGYKLKTPIQIPLEKILAVGQRGLIEYVLRSLLAERPRLIPFVVENRSLLQLADHFLYELTGSPKTLYVNVDCIWRYANRTGKTPDELISDIRDENGLVKPERVPVHVKALKDYVRELRDEELASSRIANHVKAIRGLYRTNGIEIDLPNHLSRRSVRRDRAPKPEELQSLLDVADLREKVIVSMLALGGFREGTMVRLQYRHVREDLERGIVPLHVHVEAEITKGKYHDYDTFLGEEAVAYLRLYLEARRRGHIHPEIPPEEISDESPLIRDEVYEVSRPLGEKQLYNLIHRLYFKAGLLREKQKSGYDLRVHSIRKFFKTQLMALGIQGDYVDYMMGHTVDVYNDIQSKGVEFLRGLYANSGLTIRPKASLTPKEQLRMMARGFGLSPEEAARLLTSSEPHRIYLSQEEREEHEIRVLCDAITERIRQRILPNR